MCLSIMRFLIPLLFIFSFGCKKDQITIAYQVPQTNTYSFLALGDSYTIGQGVSESNRWPNQLRDSLVKQNILFTKPQIIARTGWRSDQLQMAMDTVGKKDWDLVTLLIGVNDYYQNWPAPAFKPKFETALDSAISLAGGLSNRVVVLSIPDYGFTPFGQSNQQQITAGITAYNNVLEEVCQAKNVVFVNITDISQRGLQEPDLVAGDGLHPSGKQYSLWVERLITNPFFQQYQ